MAVLSVTLKKVALVYATFSVHWTRQVMFKKVPEIHGNVYLVTLKINIITKLYRGCFKFHYVKFVCVCGSAPDPGHARYPDPDPDKTEIGSSNKKKSSYDLS